MQSLEIKRRSSIKLYIAEPHIIRNITPKSVFSSIFNLSNTILGPAIVSIPFAFQTVGLGLGTFLLVICMFCAWYSLNIMVVTAQTHAENSIPRSLMKMNGEPSFSSIASILKVSILTDTIVAMSCLAFSISYLISVGETAPRIMESLQIESIMLKNKYFWIFLFSIITGSMSFVDDLDSITWYSPVSFASAIYMILFIICSSIGSSLHVDQILWPDWNTGMFDTIPIFVFGLTCHQSVFSIYKNINANYKSGSALDEAKLRHIYTTIDLSILGVGIIYFLVGLCGLLTFGKDTDLIILNKCITFIM
jgi:amino acid permease